MIMMLLGFALPYIVVLMHLLDKKNGNMDETKTQSALQMFLRATRSQARSSDQTDSAGKPTSDVVENLGAAVRKLEDIFVRVAMHHVSTSQIGRPGERNLRSNLATLGQLVRTDERDFEHHLAQARNSDRRRAWPPSKIVR